MPSPALGFGYAVATSLRFRARRFSTMEPATRSARLGSDLASAAGSGLGTTFKSIFAWEPTHFYQAPSE